MKKMLIGLISDTHIPDRAKEIPQKVFDAFSEVDLILHAGDLTSLKVIEDLEKIAPVMAIQGNMDRVNGINLPAAKVLEAEGLKIGIAHGEVYPRADTQQLVYLARELDVDILITGHSHQPKIEQTDGVLLLNPGSPIVPRLADRTVMILEINNKEVDVEIVKIGAPVCSALDFDQYKRD
ncbi:metallophosphoesterase [uncultured Methanobrevibacter sp.]|uniref:metallophosphoesterase n=1 Tax=uncultured Methanobrevibacter sp. TaxID=253161 RepID=UPI0025E5A44E|nr:metallophosphoesterase [uncultured Methanobrevibacter sp.]